MKNLLLLLLWPLLSLKAWSGEVPFTYDHQESASEIKIERSGELLSMIWEIETNRRAKISFGLKSADALIESLQFQTGVASKTILRSANPEFQLFIGERNLARNK